MKNARSKVGGLVVAALLACGLAWLLRAGMVLTPADEQATIPAWTLRDLDGRSIHLANFEGRVIVLNFWAT